MCPKTSKTTPLLLIAGICFVIVLVGITGITLINNINLSNIIRLNEKVASDSVTNNENQIKELNYVNNHPRNIYAKLNASKDMQDMPGEEEMQREQEQLPGVPFSQDNPGQNQLPTGRERERGRERQTLASTSTFSPFTGDSPPLPFGGVKSNDSAGLIDYEKRERVVQVSQGLSGAGPTQATRVKVAT